MIYIEASAWLMQRMRLLFTMKQYDKRGRQWQVGK